MLLFSQRFKELRKSKKFSQEFVAEKLGITSQAISKWECAQSYPDIELIPVIADIFDVTIDSLFKHDDTTDVKPILPFPNDNKIRLIRFNGHQIIDCNEFNSHYITYRPKQDESSIEVWGDCIVEGDLLLNLASNGSVNCKNVAGNVYAGDTVKCNDVIGNVTAGTEVSCQDISGNVVAGTEVFCNNMLGEVNEFVDVNSQTQQANQLGQAIAQQVFDTDWSNQLGTIITSTVKNALNAVQDTLKNKKPMIQEQ